MISQTNTIDEQRTELYNFFDTDIYNWVFNSENISENDCEIIQSKFIKKFGKKYNFIVRLYNQTIRISAYRNNIAYFMVVTPKNKEKTIFDIPAYGQNLNKDGKII